MNQRENTLKELPYETVLVKVVMAFVAAVIIVLSVIFLMGINLATCNPLVLAFGVSVVTLLLWVCTMV